MGMRIPPRCSALGVLLLTLSAAVPVGAQTFSLQTGPAVAAMPDPTIPGVKKFKDVSFVVRAVNCGDVSTFRVTASASGAADGTGTATPMKVLDVRAGTVALGGLEMRGLWVASVSATCGREVAGATLVLVNGVYRREAVETLPHHPGAADVARAFARAGGGNQRP